MKLLVFWFPMICVLTMAAAGLVCFYLGMHRKGVFWMLDAAITAWSAFALF
jgi:hypothetical protein